MSNPTFCTMDGFAEEKYAGNKLAVVSGASRLPDVTLQKVAAEMNYPRAGPQGRRSMGRSPTERIEEYLHDVRNES